MPVNSAHLFLELSVTKSTEEVYQSKWKLRQKGLVSLPQRAQGWRHRGTLQGIAEVANTQLILRIGLTMVPLNTTGNYAKENPTKCNIYDYHGRHIKILTAQHLQV